MEPMNLGSPSGSGTSPAYLPCYLMGDPQAPSPDKSRNISFLMGGNSPDYNPSVTGQRMLFGSQYQQTPTNHHSTVATSVPGTPTLHQAQGPPILGLFDTLSAKATASNLMEQSQLGTPIRGQHYSQHQTSNMNKSAFSLNQSVQPLLNDSNLMNNASINASRQNLSTYETIHPYGPSKGLPLQSSNSQRDNFWITVFGYPPSEYNTILQHFTNCGTIVDKILAPNNGNWMHIRFFSRSECDHALNYNEKILFNNVMIGVTYCRDRSVVEKENISDFETSRPQIRSLAKNFNNTMSPGVASPIVKRPSSFLDKAMEVLWNW